MLLLFLVLVDVLVEANISSFTPYWGKGRDKVRVTVMLPRIHGNHKTLFSPYTSSLQSSKDALETVPVSAARNVQKVVTGSDNKVCHIYKVSSPFP